MTIYTSTIQTLKFYFICYRNLFWNNILNFNLKLIIETYLAYFSKKQILVYSFKLMIQFGTKTAIVFNNDFVDTTHLRMVLLAQN